MHSHRKLLELFDEVNERSQALALTHAQWPCARGCGACCQKLARVPELTRSEWQLFEEAMLSLPETVREECLAKARLLARELNARGEEGPCVCPMFDAEAQACRVYAARPLACRSYGFYAGRSHDAWCNLVAEHVREVRDTLVFGNLDALEARLARMGSESRDLLSWLAL
jgi:Fe-S-cluster containining protein